MNFLENEGVESFLKDEIIGSRGGTWGPGGSVKVIVSEKDYDKARIIVSDFEELRKNEIS